MYMCGLGLNCTFLFLFHCTTDAETCCSLIKKIHHSQHFVPWSQSVVKVLLSRVMQLNEAFIQMLLNIQLMRVKDSITVTQPPPLLTLFCSKHEGPELEMGWTINLLQTYWEHSGWWHKAALICTPVLKMHPCYMHEVARIDKTPESHPTLQLLSALFLKVLF